MCYAVSALTDGDCTAEGLSTIEDPPTHSYDIWAVFTAPEGTAWNLSKVSVYIPENNKGMNDNDKEGFVNKDIKICYGSDMNNLKDARTFESLEETSRLDYIFPSFVQTKYIVVKCNLNAYFYPSLAEIEAFEQHPDAIPVNGPVQIADWQHDVIVESLSAADHSNYTLDDQRWCLYTTVVQETGVIAGSDRKVVTSNGTEFCLAPRREQCTRS